MIRSRNTPAIRLGLIAFATLLPVNFLAMLCTGWGEQGTLPNTFLVSATGVVLNILLFPMHTIENIFRNEPFSGALFFIGDVLCLTFWAFIYAAIHAIIRKKIQKPAPKKRL